MPPELAVSGAQEHRPAGMKVIIVDDSKEYMMLARRLLARAMPDVEVTEYDPEQQGIPGPNFEWSIYDALLLDYDLGTVENGLSWLQRFRDIPGFPPVILMTATGDEYVAARAIKLGAAEFIKKADATPERLAALIAVAVAERQAQRTQPERHIHRKLEEDQRIVESVSSLGEQTPDGRRIGYRFVRLIGQGANSRVYLAERMKDRTTLVLKIIDVAAIKEPNILQRFIREAELLAQIESQYVVRFIEHGFTQKYGYIAMEFFTRGDLKQRIEHGIAVNEAVLYLEHIAYGLHAVHRQGVIHRDLKPGNIMFRSDDSLALADFGISRRLDETSDITRLGSVLGTPNYISPEQAIGGVVDIRSDLYSAGIIFYEMLVGRKPYRADNAPALVYQHVHAPIPYLPHALRRFQPIIEMLLAKDPNDRFATAKDLLAGLSAITRVPNIQNN
ncbi:MAG: protein kinase [Gammaproteobacteria bacterium]|nr:protein kinase [Gammaproteobacteria bacterium]MBI5615441.1 protein kinase [Gammaproteobacteria bacterium]